MENSSLLTYLLHVSAKGYVDGNPPPPPSPLQNPNDYT